MFGLDAWPAALESAAPDLAAPFRAIAGVHFIAAQIEALDAALAAGSARRGSRGVGR